MLFNSFNFWLLFPVIFAIYWAIPFSRNDVRKAFLIIMSYLLYMNWKPVFAIVLLGVTFITYFGGCWLDGTAESRKRKCLVWLFTMMGLFPLLIFKYYNFINETVTEALSLAGLKFSLPGLNWAIPIGISFFTFQAVGYMLDVYHKRIPAEKNVVDYILFVSFFPQITSGPISKASELLPQIKQAHIFNYQQGKEGLKLLLWGMFLKCVVADRLGLYVDKVYANYEHFSGLNCLAASVLYSIQIYGDFAGYSLMAIGIAKTLGFDLVKNFNRPYFASSLTEFWRRWHISLTRWLTTHVYINLGGGRCSKVKQYRNILVTFLVSGLWHGANWTFIVWGTVHGFLLVVEKALGIDPKGSHYASFNGKRYLKPLRILLTFLLVNFAWIFFRMPTIGDAFDVLSRIFTHFGGQSLLYKAQRPDRMFMSIAIVSLMCVEVWQEYLRKKNRVFNNRFIKFMIYVCLFCMILCMGVLDSSSFIYVQF